MYDLGNFMIKPGASCDLRVISHPLKLEMPPLRADFPRCQPVLENNRRTESARAPFPLKDKTPQDKCYEALQSLPRFTFAALNYTSTNIFFELYLQIIL